MFNLCWIWYYNKYNRSKVYSWHHLLILKYLLNVLITCLFHIKPYLLNTIPLFVFNNADGSWKDFSLNVLRKISKWPGKYLHRNFSRRFFLLGPRLPISRLVLFLSFPYTTDYVHQFIPNQVHQVQNMKNLILLFGHLRNYLKEKKTPPRALSKLLYHNFNPKIFPVVPPLYPQVLCQIF